MQVSLDIFKLLHTFANFFKNQGLEIFTTQKSLQGHLLSINKSGKTIGLVPTMGALHDGHLSLLKIAQQQTGVTVVTIFVNPTQFTNADDLKNYPRPVEADISKLSANGCDILFMPAVDEMYAGNEQWHIELGDLEQVLEGKFRPGHYQGVTQIVYKIFKLVNPDKAFFGQKDYQQFLVIDKMVQLMHLPVELVMCPILREEDGLAMSSRNVHLSAEEHRHALVLSKALRYVAENFEAEDLQLLLSEARLMIAGEDGVELEYLEAANAETLQPADSNSPGIVVLVAARVGKTRLIDNMILR